MRSPAAIALVLAACGTPPASPPPTTAAPVTAVEGPIAATVDGDPIAVSEVEEAARAAGIAPIDALHRLEQERALLHRARGASLGGDAEADDAMRRASVQALLRARVEDAVGDASVTDDEIAARYESTRASWARPERRASTHLLLAPHDDAARPAAQRFATEAVTRLRAAADPIAEAHAIAAEVVDRTFDARVEDVPPAPRAGTLEPPYAAALFALGAPHAVSDPTTSSSGIHVIVLTAIAPAFEVSLEEAAPILRRQLVTEHRGAALDALTDDLRAHNTVAVDERLAASVFSRDLDAP